MGKRELAVQNTAYVMEEPGLEMPITGVVQTKHLQEHQFDQWQAQYRSLKSDNDCHLRRLETENSRLRMIIEDLTQDKLAQARRIKELGLENSQIKQLIAELTLCQQILKKAL